MSNKVRAIGEALGWSVLITSAEWGARRTFKARSTAWVMAYGGLAVAAAASGARVRATDGELSWKGLALAAFGYPLGRGLLGDRESSPPPDGFAHELVAIEVVAATEELTWGAIVEPALGPTLTAALFAGKHAVIDGRWRRLLGLFLFWSGLATQRRRWPTAALIAHALLNAIGVVRGHRSGRDQF